MELPSIGVIGAGVMGSGIAQVTATAGCETVCTDISAEALAEARRSVEEGRFGLRRGVERGKLSAEGAEAARTRLRFSEDFEEAARAELVIECVPEQLELKIRTFRRLDAAAPEGTILASNTSGFPVAALAAATERPASVLAWHWASPPVVMRFAEIVVTPETSPGVRERVVALARACGKNPVVVRDAPTHWGFVANRIYGAMLREAALVAREGVATHEEINQLMVDCFNWPIGPFGMVEGAGSGWK